MVGGATAAQAFATSFDPSGPFPVSFFADLGFGRSPYNENDMLATTTVLPGLGR